MRHPKWGPGVVQEKLVFRVVRVQFDRSPNLPRRLKLSELELLVDGAGAGASEPGLNGMPPTQVSIPRSVPAEPVPAQPVLAKPVPARPLTAPPVPTPRVPVKPLPARPAYRTRLEQDDAWQTLEALRLGVVPARGVRDYTVAREQELGNITALLEQGSGCRVLWGDYGTGKTHLLEAVEQLALEQGFAAARVTLDPRENALHHPLRLYRRIADSVRTSDQATPGFESVFERLVDSPDHYRPDGTRASRFFTPYLHALRNGNAEDVGWLRDYVRGDNIGSEEVNYVLHRLRWNGANVLRLSDFRTYGRMYVHMVGTLACWCADAGTRGLILLFDEVERVDALNSADQQYAFEVLRHYAAVTMKAGDLAFDPEALYKGGRLVHRELPLRFRDPQPLISIFALTPLEEIREQLASLTSSKVYDVHLAPLEPGFLGELVERIAALYERAYPGHEVSVVARDSAYRRISEAHDGGHDSFRDAVRATVFLLDADRFRGAEPAPG